MLHNDLTASSRTYRSAMPHHPSRPVTGDAGSGVADHKAGSGFGGVVLTVDNGNVT